jgi:hypothetical protein
MPPSSSIKPNDFLTALQIILCDLLACARNLQKSPAKIDCFATSLPMMLLFDDNIQFRQAQAQLGLGWQPKPGICSPWCWSATPTTLPRRICWKNCADKIKPA